MDGRLGADGYLGGPGSDEVDYSGRHRKRRVRVSVGAGAGDDGSSQDGPKGARDTLGDDVDLVVGTRFGDRLLGSASNEILVGLRGADVIKGNGGYDTIEGRHGRDRIFGGGQPDGLFGGAGIDRLFALDGIRDRLIDCGKGGNGREKARVDRRDPEPVSC